MQFRGGVLLLTLLLIVGINVSNKPGTIVKEISKEQIRKEFAIYKQNTDKTKYEEVEDNTFPDKGYLLNETLTKCYGYNGNKLNSNPVTQELTDGVINGSITINSNNTIYCVLYFDIDDKVPEVKEFSITGKTSSGDTLTNGFTYQTDNIPYTLEYGDNDVTQYCISNTSECTEWKEISEKTDTLTIDNSDGEKTMYIYLKDKANNVSVTTNKSTAKITVDRTKPKITSFTLTGTADEGQTLSDPLTYTHTKNIKYNASITESNIDSYCTYEDSCDYKTADSTTLTNKEYSLKDTEGSHTVNIRVKDKAGNESDVSTQSIKLDKTNPTATISSSSKDTSSITVTVGYSGDDSIISRQCRLSLPTVGEWKNTEPDGSCTISNLSDGAEYTIEARVRDASGRWNTTYPSVGVTTESADFSGTGKQLIDYKPKGLSSEPDCQGMKRFVGQCSTYSGGCDGIVDNYVCFGYKDETDCKKGIVNNNYLYRIIGITSNGEMKLIKDEALPSRYVWDDSRDDAFTWVESDLCLKLNGADFLAGFSSDWQSKILDHTWMAGVIENEDMNASSICLSESTLFSEKSAKVGLISLTDYWYAYKGAASNCREGCAPWIFTNSEYDSETRAMLTMTNANWYGEVWGFWSVEWDGFAYEAEPGVYPGFVQPVFYLSPDAFISSGSGTSSDPFIIDLCDGNPLCNRNPGDSGSTD